MGYEADASRRTQPAGDPRTQRNLSAQGLGRDTGPELALRRYLHARGLRYRVDLPLPFNRRRRADIAFLRERVAVMVDGCFWHGCPDHHRPPKRNADWWDAKIKRNQARDADTDRRLRDLGWLPVRVWEHENPREAADRVEAIVRMRRHQVLGDGGGPS